MLLALGKLNRTSFPVLNLTSWQGFRMDAYVTRKAIKWNEQVMRLDELYWFLARITSRCPFCAAY